MIVHVAWPGTPCIYATGVTPTGFDPDPGSDSAGGAVVAGATVPIGDAIGVDPSFGGIIGYGPASVTYPDDWQAPKGPWAAVTSTGVIMVTNQILIEDHLIAAFAAAVQSPVTVFLYAEAGGYYSLRYYAGGELLRRVTEDAAAADTGVAPDDSGAPLPYEVEIAESWWGEDYTGQLMYQNLFVRTTGSSLDILGCHPIRCTEVLTPPLLPTPSQD